MALDYLKKPNNLQQLKIDQSFFSHFIYIFILFDFYLKLVPANKQYLALKTQVYTHCSARNNSFVISFSCYITHISYMSPPPGGEIILKKYKGSSLRKIKSEP